MSLGFYLAAVVLASVVMSFSDWYFIGVLFHDKYLAHPEIWRRPEGGSGERLAIAWSTLLGLFTAAVFIGLAVVLNVAGTPRVFTLACGVWLLAPLPLLLTQGMFIKLHPLNVLAHALGWLARLLLCALASWLFLR